MRDAEMLYVVGRFKSLLIAADGEKYSPEGIEENLVENSKYIDGALMHNSQDPYTIALITPNKEALKAYVKELGLDPAAKEAKVKMLEKLQVKEREEIFQVHLRKLKLADDFDLEFLAKHTPGFSGADIANVCNEAALTAARKNKPAIDRQDFLDAVDRTLQPVWQEEVPMRQQP